MMVEEIPPTVRQRLKSEGLGFYRDYLPLNRERVVNGVESTFVGFMDDVLAFLTDMPEAKGKLAGRGFTQIEATQRMSQVLKELRQFRAFLDDNRCVPLGDELNRDALDGKRSIGKYAAAIIANIRFDGDGFLYDPPKRIRRRLGETSARRNKPIAALNLPWLASDASVDVRRLDRVARRRADTEQSPFQMLEFVGRDYPKRFRSFRATMYRFHGAIEPDWFAEGMSEEEIDKAKRQLDAIEAQSALLLALDLILELSAGGANAFSIDDLIEGTTPDTRFALAELTARAEKRLKVLLGLPDDFGGEGSQRPLVFFEGPCPLYRLVGRLVDVGWSPLDDNSLMGPRMLDREDARELEERFGRLLSRVVSHAANLASTQEGTWRKLGGFRAEIGFEANQASKDLDKAKSDYHVQFMTRVARAYVRKREQAIVIRDHAERLLLWHDDIRDNDPELGRANDAQPRCADSKLKVRALSELWRLGVERLRDWASETEDQLEEGILFSPDFARRSAGPPVRVPELSLKALTEPYDRPRSSVQFGGIAYANVAPASVRRILEICHGGNLDKRERVTRAFDLVEPLFRASAPQQRAKRRRK
jgi:hypothetical protein